MCSWKARLLAGFAATIILAQAAVCFAEMSAGQTVYVPCYSHIYHGVKTSPFYLTVTLSVRNIDLKRSMYLASVDYYDTEGKMIRSYITNPELLPPLMTKEYIVDLVDTSGGSGANFIVRWSSEAIMNAPIIESVMVGTGSQQGVSFTSRGVAIGE
jgi:hypothetical protein